MTNQRKCQGHCARLGAAAVELALLLPFLMFLLVIAVDYARLFYFAVTVQNCARNGAYYASKYPNNSHLYTDIHGYTSVTDAVRGDASNLSPQPTYVVRYATCSCGPFNLTTQPSGECHVKVTVSWTFHSITNFPLVPREVDISRAAVMRVAPTQPTFN